MINLEDFSTKELLFLSVCVTEKIDEYMDKLAMIENFDLSDTKTDLHDFYTDKLATACQWRTKIQEAYVQVRTQETIKSN